MRATKAWQKFTTAFKKPFQKLFTKTPERPEVGDAFFHRESGESVYLQKKTLRKLRKRRKRMENKSRAVNYQKNKKR